MLQQRNNKHYELNYYWIFYLFKQIGKQFSSDWLYEQLESVEHDFERFAELLWSVQRSDLVFLRAVSVLELEPINELIRVLEHDQLLGLPGPKRPERKREPDDDKRHNVLLRKLQRNSGVREPDRELHELGC